MNDRFILGGIAGGTSAIIQYLFGMTAKALGLTDRTFGDFAEAMVAHKECEGLFDVIMGFVSHTIVGLLFGIIFAYLLQQISSKGYLIKSIFYGAIIWFILESFGSIFKIPNFTEVPPAAQFFTLLGSIIYGILTAYILKYLQDKSSINVR